MIVALITNHIVSAIDAYITTVRYNRSLITQTSYKRPSIQPINSIYFTDAGLKTEVGILWKF